MSRPFENIENRFWKHVQKKESCWLYIGSNVDGYGRICVRGANSKRMYAHRYSWELHYGKIETNKLVLHSCDIRNCVNPKHLWIGTNSQNMRDMVKKRRSPNNRGENNPRAKLTIKMVRRIRKLAAHGCSLIGLANIFKITSANVSCIVHRKSWNQ